LAHLHLAGDDPELIVGQVLGDFLERGWKERIPPGVREGVRLHQQIDAFTDSHPVVARSRNRIAAPFRRYAGILVDVYYDHFLALRWGELRPDEPLEDFAERMYRTLERRPESMTPSLRRALPRMRRHNWLVRYRDREGIAQTLRGIGRRLRRDNPLDRAVSPLDQSFEAFERDFLAFFPELEAHVEREANPPDEEPV